MGMPADELHRGKPPCVVFSPAPDNDHHLPGSLDTPQPVTVMAGGSLRQSVLLPEKIDRPRFPIVLRIDPASDFVGIRQRLINTRDRFRHLLPAMHVGIVLRKCRLSMSLLL